MPEELNAREERLENLMVVLPDRQAKLDDVLVVLTEARIQTQERFREMDDRFRETDDRFRDIHSLRELEHRLGETDEHLRRMDQASRARDRVLDERVDRLVSAIGEFIRSRDAGPITTTRPVSAQSYSHNAWRTTAQAFGGEVCKASSTFT